MAINTPENSFFRMCNNKYLNYTCKIFVITSILIILYCLRTANISDYFSLCSTLLILQFFGFFCGSFFGFLFGFPNHNNKKFTEKYQRNSSLKEITSWLTKIIVGVTLIEFKNIVHSIYKLIKQTSEYIVGDMSLAPIMGSILGLYFIIGFIVFFILSVTTIFEELVANDNNIEKLLSSNGITEVLDGNDSTGIVGTDNINHVLSNDVKSISRSHREEILKYVGTNGVHKLDSFLTKRLAKVLLTMEEYSSAADAYEAAHEKNNSDIFSLLNSCYIRSKFLKDFDSANKKLKAYIKINPNFAPAYYNLACNYWREYNDFQDKENNNYISKLKHKAEENLLIAFQLNKGLYSEALKDEALQGLDINKIFAESKTDVELDSPK